MESKSVSVRPWVLWIREPVNLSFPVAIMTAGRLEDMRNWQQANRWADGVPFIAFGADDMAPLGTAFQDARRPPDGVPWLVENAPQEAWDAWDRPPGYTDFGARVNVYANFARVCAAKVRPGPIWVIAAGADEGILAVSVAAERGRVVALSDGPPGVMCAHWAQTLGVDVSSRERSTVEV